MTSAEATPVYVHAARIALEPGADPAGVGAAVTVALCGHWEHDGPCRWPHHNAGGDGDFRTLFVATPEQESQVRGLIEGALRSGPWQVLDTSTRPPDAAERRHGERIARTPPFWTPGDDESFRPAPRA